MINMVISKSVCSNIHQGVLGLEGLSSSYGTQCTAIAMVALIYLSTMLYPASWQSEDMDKLIYEGDALYQTIIQSRYQGNASALLNHDDIPSTLTIFNQRFLIMREQMLYGLVSQKSSNIDFGSVTIETALSNAFDISPWSLATFGGTSVAIFITDGNFHVFDSHARNSLGHVDPNGSSFLLTFNTFTDLCLYIQAMYNGSVFNISPVNIFDSTSSNNVTELGPSSPSNAVSEQFTNTADIGETDNYFTAIPLDLPSMDNDESVHLNNVVNDQLTHKEHISQTSCGYTPIPICLPFQTNNHTYHSMKLKKARKCSSNKRIKRLDSSSSLHVGEPDDTKQFLSMRGKSNVVTSFR